MNVAADLQDENQGTVRVSRRRTGGGVRRKDKLANQAHYIISEWANCRLKYESGNCLGYPSSTQEGRMQKGEISSGSGGSKSRVPNNLDTGVQISKVERCYNTMPELFRDILQWEYLENWPQAQKRLAFALKHDLAERKYRDTLDSARMFVLGAITN